MQIPLFVLNQLHAATLILSAKCFLSEYKKIPLETMFLILQGDNYNGKKRSTPKRKHSIDGNLKFIVGTRLRSKNGCTVCRRKKRKCDEVHPVCNYCYDRGFDCSYEFPMALESQRRKSEPQLRVLSEGLHGKTVNEKSTELEQSPSAIVPITTNYNVDLAEQVIANNYTFTRQPLSLPVLLLDEDGIYSLSYYHNKVSDILTFSDNCQNFFTSFYLNLAYHEESFLYVISSWGALYSGKDNVCKHNFTKAITKFEENFNSGSSADIYFKICFNCVLVGFYACIGDTTAGYKIFEQTSDLIRELGGLKKFAELFHFTNEVRFMISNIQYCDLMHTTSHKKGTIFTVDEYREVYNCSKFIEAELVYGIDNLQGIHLPIYVIYMDLINLKVRINNLLYQLQLEEDDTLIIGLKSELFDIYSKEVKYLEVELETTQPNYLLLDTVEEETSRTNYLNVFYLYKATCELYIKLYIMKTTPTSPIIRELFSKVMSGIDSLTHTKYCCVLCLPLLMCGVCAASDSAKKRVHSKIEQLTKLSPVLNNQKSWKLITKAWDLNPTDEKVIDWADIAEDFGWKLNLS